MPGRFECRDCRDNNKGKGLYALTVIEKGEDIVEYVGECVTLQREKLTSYEYILHLQNSYYLDARKKGNLARFINHSCNPNTECQKNIVSSLFTLLF
jgi:SET domain-containing protein